MRWPKFWRTKRTTDTDAVDDTPAEPAQTEAVGREDNDASTEDEGPELRQGATSAASRVRWRQAIAYGVLPGLALLLAAGAGFLKWQDGLLHSSRAASAESVQAATDGTVALLSYRPDTVDKDLEAARGRLTGTFLNAYTSLTHDVVIPGSKQKQISAVATVPAAASIEATDTHAVVLLFVNQTIIIGQDAPTNTASTVRVTLDRVHGRWLIAGFDPV
ncbi:hypothetical protein MSAS_45220 [Mycobacterium saskatchewanense]|uniref:Outer membrane protein n=1 Tax=Mycobacterium saskatchewanense TaxID=220927 RepID=A0AAJ3NU12_9MYCO|nr:hypothetical protein [Mycobacterium saskatchewanense]ORW74646.1 hypothetical protein AWC23_04500 [Mycobacterium saskatchewanense]BBX65348.1 hypothetical protein MSAS_45220 [Mycobacterium saskatchewanense]